MSNTTTVYTLFECTTDGDYLIGVFSSLEGAREKAGDKYMGLFDYVITPHRLDGGREPGSTWVLDDQGWRCYSDSGEVLSG